MWDSLITVAALVTIKISANSLNQSVVKLYTNIPQREDWKTSTVFSRILKFCFTKM